VEKAKLVVKEVEKKVEVKEEEKVDPVLNAKI